MVVVLSKTNIAIFDLMRHFLPKDYFNVENNHLFCMKIIVLTILKDYYYQSIMKNRHHFVIINFAFKITIHP